MGRAPGELEPGERCRPCGKNGGAGPQYTDLKAVKHLSTKVEIPRYPGTRIPRYPGAQVFGYPGTRVSRYSAHDVSLSGVSETQ